MFSDEAIALIVTRKSASYQVAACREPDHNPCPCRHRVRRPVTFDSASKVAEHLRVRAGAAEALARLGPHAEEEQIARTSTSRGENR